MPALDLEARETDCRYSRSFHQKSEVPLTDEEALAAEEHLLIYCKPVELYNILQRRAKQNPPCLQRCLSYRKQAKDKKRLRSGAVLFNYRYYKNMLQKTEVTMDFTCPFCSVQCASTEGLRYHLMAYHDLFNFEFWITEKFQAINVSVRTDIWKPEVAVDDLDIRHHPFFYSSKFKRRRKSENIVSNASHVYPHVLESDSAEPTKEGCDEDRLLKDSRISYQTIDPKGLTGCREIMQTTDITSLCGATTQASISTECAMPVSERNRAPPTKIKSANTQKISEQADTRNSELLKKRQFFHSHIAQPMALEEVFSDCDSEAEMDLDTEDLNDEKFLDDFVDVAKEEKQIMHLWNSFVRKQRVLADGHISWACEAFSRLHGKHLVETPALLWCWRLFMVKLWNQNLLGAEMMNNCNLFLQECRKEDSEKYLPPNYQSTSIIVSPTLPLQK